MPNFCSNEIVITGPKDELHRFSERLKQENGTYRFSFDTFIPTPPPLKLIVSGAYTDDQGVTHHNYRYKHNKTNAIVPPESFRNGTIDPREVYADPLTREEKQDLMSQYGLYDWHEWRLANWGTKWDLSDSICDVNEDQIVINGDTAWSPAEQFFIKVSKEYPELTFTISFAECGCNFYGTIAYHNGAFNTLVYEEPSGGFWLGEEDDDGFNKLRPEVEQFLEAHGLSSGG